MWNEHNSNKELQLQLQWNFNFVFLKLLFKRNKLNEVKIYVAFEINC
jgi:hypothetical protein